MVGMFDERSEKGKEGVKLQTGEIRHQSTSYFTLIERYKVAREILSVLHISAMVVFLSS